MKNSHIVFFFLFQFILFPLIAKDKEIKKSTEITPKSYSLFQTTKQLYELGIHLEYFGYHLNKQKEFVLIPQKYRFKKTDAMELIKASAQHNNLTIHRIDRYGQIYIILYRKTSDEIIKTFAKKLNKASKEEEYYICQDMINSGDIRIIPLLEEIKANTALEKINLFRLLMKNSMAYGYFVKKPHYDFLNAIYQTNKIEKKELIKLIPKINQRKLTLILKDISTVHYLFSEVIQHLSPDAAVQFLESNNNKLRSAAHNQIGRNSSPVILDALRKAVVNKDFKIRYWAAMVIKNIGTQEATDIYLDSLNRETFNSSNIKWLGEIGSDKAIDHLIWIKEYKNHSGVKSGSIKALGKIGNEKAINVLIQEIDNQVSKYPSGSDYAFQALAGIGGEKIEKIIIKYVSHERAHTRLGAIRALKTINSKSSLKAIEIALNDKDPKIKELAKSYLSKEAEIDYLVKKIKDSKHPWRVKYMEEMITIGGDRAFAILKKYIDDNSGSKTDAILTLAVVDKKYKPLNILKKTSSDPKVAIRRATAKTLRKIGGKETIPILGKGVTDKDISVKFESFRGLVEIGGEDAFKFIEIALKDKIFYERSLFAELIKNGSDLAIESLQPYLLDKEYRISSLSRVTIETIGGKKALEVLKNAHFNVLNKRKNYKGINKVLENLSLDDSISFFEELINDKDKILDKKAADFAAGRIISNKLGYRWWAVRHLGRYGGDDRAIKLIQSSTKGIHARTDANNLKRIVLVQLGNIGGPISTDITQGMLKDSWGVRKEVVHTLAKLDHQLLFDAYQKEVKNDKSKIFILQFIGEMGGDKAFQLVSKDFDNEKKPVEDMRITTLGLLGHDKSFVILKKEFDKKGSRYKAEIVRAISVIGGEKAIEFLVATFKSGGPLKKQAISGLAEIGGETAYTLLKNSLKQHEIVLDEEVFEILSRIGTIEAIDVLRTSINNQNVNLDKVPIEALGKIGDDKAFELLLPSLDHKYVSVKVKAINALADFNNEKTIDLLILNLENKKYELYKAAQNGLIKNKGEMVFNKLFKILKSEHSIKVKNRAIKVLKDSYRKDPEVIKLRWLKK
ncbi:MAG: hypothetical protein MJH11_08355 [Lentisphaeria bacterium]|nr:hypothetical protein [Lentisphaeria bacterium]